MKGVAQPENLHKTWTTNRVNSKWPTGHISGRTKPTGGSIATQISNGTYAAHSRGVFFGIRPGSRRRSADAPPSSEEGDEFLIKAGVRTLSQDFGKASAGGRSIEGLVFVQINQYFR